MILKNELKKRMQKRAKKAAAATATTVRNTTSIAVQKSPGSQEPKALPEKPTVNQNTMFEQGFLAEVYKVRPLKRRCDKIPTRTERLFTCNFLHSPLLLNLLSASIKGY